MRTSTGIACLVLGILSAALPACSSSDSGGGADAATECKKLSGAICKQFYKCFTADELAAAADEVGTSEADCETKQNASNCADTACAAGKTYQASSAESCVSAFEAFTCDEIAGFGDTTATPAACESICK